VVNCMSWIHMVGVFVKKFWANYIMGHFSGYFERASTSLHSGQFRGRKSLGPLEISLEMAHYVVCPQKKKYPPFQNQRCLNSYNTLVRLDTE
jgi:hypothetical protein